MYFVRNLHYILFFRSHFSFSLLELYRRRHTISKSQALYHMSNLISGICYLQTSKKIGHRDPNLAKVFLDQNLECKIGDFGLVVKMEKNAADFCLEGVVHVIYTLLVGMPVFARFDPCPYWKIKRGIEVLTRMISKDPKHRPVLSVSGYNNYNMTLSLVRCRGMPRTKKKNKERRKKEYEKDVLEGQNGMCKIKCKSAGVYCLQYDSHKIVSGSRGNTIKIFDRQTKAELKCLRGHTGPVLCLQYDSQVIITGSSDSTVRVWDVDTGESLQTIKTHSEAVNHLKFANGMMVTCSQDSSIVVWDMVTPKEIKVKRVIKDHRAAVNVIDFDERYIVSASGDRTIKVWNTDNKQYVRTLAGHKRDIPCLQYRYPTIVSGSFDNCIRLWNIDDGKCCRILKGHESLVRSIWFDDKRIVSGDHSGRIKVWDLKAALDQSAPIDGNYCIKTLIGHTSGVLCVKFDDFNIVSGGLDDTIIIWDFLQISMNGNAIVSADSVAQ